MQFKRLRRVLKKQVHKQQLQVESLSQTAEKGLERNLFRRFAHLKPVRRFIFTWVALMVLIMGCLIAQFQHLSTYYQKIQPVPGGIYTEGIIGSISNVNPMYATSDVDRSLSRLVFAGLLKNDANGQLVPDLATGYTTSSNGRVYTVKLKHGLTWHDGTSLTAADVAYTFNTIKDPDARSPFFSTWQNVSVVANDAHTITFTLPGSLAVFPYYLTAGIAPKHILGKVSTANLRSADFNTRLPVGAGPFKWHGLQVSGNDPSDIEEQVALVPFDGYASGKPKLNEFIMRVFVSQDRLAEEFKTGQLTAAAGLQAVPDGAPKSTVKNNLLLAAGTYVFFKTTAEPLNSVKVRQALVAASNPQKIIDSLGYMTRPVMSPLLVGQLGYNKNYTQKTTDIATAQRLLAEDGWAAGPTGTLTKNGKSLTFSLVASDTPEYRKVTNQLRDQWKAIGVQADVQLVSSTDYSTILAGHTYDATVYGISIGDDPDVYAFWDSSQADVRSNARLNLSEWKNTAADSALEAGRTRLDPAIRTVKYAPFLQAWQQEAPALGLYQPRYLYLTHGTLYGLTEHSIANGVNRFNGVEDWQIRTARTTQK
jgi:peptide/nickel transport system substrate-binding protein